MKGAFWNIRSVGKKGAVACVKDMMFDYSLDFIGIQETMKENYKMSFFRKLDPKNEYFWKWTPPIGKSGGILCGIRNDSLEVNAFKAGKYMLQFILWDKVKKCNWALIVVYGAAQEENKNDFLTELASFCHGILMPYIVGGDFNILRHSGEKNKNFTHTHTSDLFNSIIHTMGLREIFMHGGKYTWSNKHASPTLEKLDRVLMSHDWEDLFPLVSVRKLVREMSDHNALLLDSGNLPELTTKSRDFRFDISWFKNEEFLPSVAKIWQKPVYNTADPIDVFNIKLKRFKKFFKGWGANLYGHTKKRKLELREELTSLECLEEETELPPILGLRKSEIYVELWNIYANEELLWYQKSHEKWLLEGDSNTSYFHRVANGRKRKNTMLSLNDNGVNIEGTEKLIEHATSYYKNLFGPAPGNILFSISTMTCGPLRRN
jgi:hypothetical protein